MKVWTFISTIINGNITVNDEGINIIHGKNSITIDDNGINMNLGNEKIKIGEDGININGKIINRSKQITTYDTIATKEIIYGSCKYVSKKSSSTKTEEFINCTEIEKDYIRAFLKNS